MNLNELATALIAAVFGGGLVGLINATRGVRRDEWRRMCELTDRLEKRVTELETENKLLISENIRLREIIDKDTPPDNRRQPVDWGRHF
jgi:hypothetical protein